MFRQFFHKAVAFCSQPATKVLVLADHNNSRLLEASLRTIKGASSIGKDITVLVAGSNCKSVAEQSAAVQGVSRVLLVDHNAFEHFIPENISKLLKSLVDSNQISFNPFKYTHCITATSTVGKSVFPHTAAKCDIQAISDVVEIKSPIQFVRPFYAANAISTVEDSQKVKFITLRPTSFPAAGSQPPAPIEMPEPSEYDAKLTSWVRDEIVKSERPDLVSAKIVVSGGRGLQTKEKFKLIYDFADMLGAAVGASRAAVDANFVSNDYQVGQTGKIVAPQLYFAIGISGAIQHVAGIKDSKIIVGVNKDPDAPIFQVADYGIVGDLFKFIPEFISQVKELKAKKA